MQDSSEPKKENGNIDWLSIGLVFAGLAILHWISKSNQQAQQGQNAQAHTEQYQPTNTYDNDEEYHIIRGSDGFIEDLKVGRHATVGTNDNRSSPVKYEPLVTESDLDNRIKQMIQKNMQSYQSYYQSNNRFAILNDNQRKQRFGFN